MANGHDLTVSQAHYDSLGVPRETSVLYEAESADGHQWQRKRLIRRTAAGDLLSGPLALPEIVGKLAFQRAGGSLLPRYKCRKRGSLNSAALHRQLAIGQCDFEFCVETREKKLREI